MAPAPALQKAQKWLRSATAKELKLADYYRRRLQKARQREDQANALRFQRYYQAHPDVKPFTHPYYWAAFVYTGL